MTEKDMTGKVGVLHWGKAVQVGKTVQSAWYDTTVMRASVTGTVDTGKIHAAMRKYFYHPGLSGSSVGGYCSVGTVKDNGDGTVDVEVVYHIGD